MNRTQPLPHPSLSSVPLHDIDHDTLTRTQWRVFAGVAVVLFVAICSLKFLTALPGCAALKQEPAVLWADSARPIAVQLTGLLATYIEQDAALSPDAKQIETAAIDDFLLAIDTHAPTAALERWKPLKRKLLLYLHEDPLYEGVGASVRNSHLHNAAILDEILADGVSQLSG